MNLLKDSAMELIPFVATIKHAGDVAEHCEGVSNFITAVGDMLSSP